jgi:hypothetical protein
MAPPAAVTVSEAHSRRVLLDTAEWHSRLEKLVTMRQETPAGVGGGDQPSPAGERNRGPAR